MMPESSSGRIPSRKSRRVVSATLKPQSRSTRVRPASTISALPWLPLPRDANRIFSAPARKTRGAPSATLFEILLENRQDARRGVRFFRCTVRAQHFDFGTGFRLRHDNAVVLGLALRGIALPERQTGP